MSFCDHRMDIGYLAVDIPDGGLTPMNVESCFVIVAPPRALEQSVSQWATYCLKHKDFGVEALE